MTSSKSVRQQSTAKLVDISSTAFLNNFTADFILPLIAFFIALAVNDNNL
jgi:hypothetical protein